MTLIKEVKYARKHDISYLNDSDKAAFRKSFYVEYHNIIFIIYNACFKFQ